jgi:predicted nucleic acid-binding protein
MASNAFLDANVLLELFFNRQRRADTEAAIIALPDDARLVTSILTVHILFYYVEKDKFDMSEANAFLSAYKILDMSAADYEWAFANDQGHFEDALQTACALRHGCRKILTLDSAFAARHANHISFVHIK